MSSTIRAACVQFFVGNDVDANLTRCLEALDEAARCNPDVVVLPEFANHLSWYEDIDHCRNISVEFDGLFLKTIGEKAAAIDSHVVVNVTLRRGPEVRATGTSLLFDNRGQLIAENDKQVYIGHENNFLAKATKPGPIIDTEIGKVGLYACMDGVINETPRSLALRGADILLNSLNSFASDEGSLHIPVRAAENKVFVVAANKIGPLVPVEMVGPISEATGIPPKFLDGAGESQIVEPDGEAIVKAEVTGEQMVYADIDLSKAHDKRRPDGTDIIKSRRPDLYRALSEDPTSQTPGPFKGAAEVNAALVTGINSIKEARASGALIVAIPPLFGLDSRSPRDAEAASKTAIEELTRICASTGVWVGTSFVIDRLGALTHCAVLIGPNGLELVQPQLHPSQRTLWSALGNRVETIDLPFGRIGMTTSDDSIYPEMFRLLAMEGVEIAISPVAPLEKWELKTGLIERAAENRMNMLAPAIAGSLGTGFAASLQTDFTVLTEWKERPFDGLLSQPELTWMEKGRAITPVTLRPTNAANKVVSMGTDLLTGRPWQLIDALTS